MSALSLRVLLGGFRRMIETFSPLSTRIRKDDDLIFHPTGHREHVEKHENETSVVPLVLTKSYY